MKKKDKYIIRKVILVIFFHFFVFNNVVSQPFHLHTDFYYFNDYHLLRHSNVFPIYNNKLKNLDSLYNEIFHVYKYKRNKGILFINPSVDISQGYDFANNEFVRYSENGFNVSAFWNNSLALFLDFNLGYSNFSEYWDSLVRRIAFVPGKGFATKRGKYISYNNHRFYVSYKLYKDYIIAEAGYNKNFFGEGCRSLFLSSYSSPYPYIKINSEIWNIKYINIWAQLQNHYNSSFSNYSEPSAKYFSSHFLSWNVNKWLNINFFETIVWQNSDSTKIKRGLDVHYINPIVFYRPVEFNLGSPDNSLFGFGLSIKMRKRNMFYSQVLIDDMIIQNTLQDIKHLIKPGDTTILYGSWMSKQAFQLGFKSNCLFGIDNLFFLTEVNLIRPYTYSHRFIHQNYAHNNQPLAHPAGANLKEICGIFGYKKSRWLFSFYYKFIETGIDTVYSHFGQDIFKTTFDGIVVPNVPPVKQWKNNIAQGIKTFISSANFRSSFILNYKLNLYLYVEFSFNNTSPKNFFNSFKEQSINIGMSTKFSDIISERF